ncbi:peptidylprolyl isomerase [Geovibrio thiophilus]|nr:SurA N-terminal domain-containing protein [Geovibrio thiophilus]
MLLLLLLSLSQQAQAQVIDRVYARVGDDVITKFDIESLNPERTKAIYAIKDQEEQKRVLADYTKKTLDFLVDQYVVLNSARREGVRVSDQEVDNAVKDVMEKNGITEQQLLELLAKENRTMAHYKWQIKMDILSTRVRSRVLAPKVVVTDDEINKYIKENGNKLDISDQLELRMLKLENRLALERALEFFKKNGSFVETTAKFAGDEEGGYLGWFEYDALDSSLKDLLKGKHKGDITAVQSFGGEYRVLYVENFKDKYEGTAEVRQTAAGAIADEKTKIVYDKWLKDSKQRILVQYMY